MHVGTASTSLAIHRARLEIGECAVRMGMLKKYEEVRGTMRIYTIIPYNTAK